MGQAQEMSSSPLVQSTPDSSDSVGRRTRSLLRELITVSSRPGILSLAGGLPDPSLFPVREYRTALDAVLATDGRALQYAPPFEPLKEEIVGLMAARGVRCTTEEVLLTTGAQQAIGIASSLLLDPYEPVLAEEATYPGLGQAVASLRPKMLTVGTDLESGMRVEAVAETLARSARPAFIYVMSDGHNPYGVSLGRAQRHRLVDLARQYRVPIVEDDPYGLLSYDGPHLPPLRSLDKDWVFHIGTFSKTIAPALRLGWMVLPADLVPRASLIKESSDLECSALTQRAVARLLRQGELSAHLDRLRQVYGVRRDALLAALRRHFPQRARWTRPRGGFFVWVQLPCPVDGRALLDAAVEEERVAFVPGQAFAVGRHPAPSGIRLSFATCTPEQIDDGVGRLARLFERRLSHV